MPLQKAVPAFSYVQSKHGADPKAREINAPDAVAAGSKKQYEAGCARAQRPKKLMRSEGELQKAAKAAFSTMPVSRKTTPQIAA